MGSRSPRAWFVAPALVAGLVVAIVGLAPPPPVAAAGAPPPGAWLRPVAGAVTRPFVAPASRYGAGHRGADLVAPIGTPVRAANAGEVSFAGSVAGSLHVVIAHPGGLRTSYSFLAGVAVRRGEHIGRGDPVGTAGGGAADHGGVLHFGLRVGDTYVDPMTLFSPTDLTRLIRLVPVDEPAQAGLDPPALELRSLADALHLPRGIPGLETAPDPGVLDQVGRVLGEVAAMVGRVVVPPRAVFTGLVTATDGWWRKLVAAPFSADVQSIAARLLAWARSRADCTSDTAAPPGGGGSGHTLLAVAGINSRTDPETGRTVELGTGPLGYHPDEIRYFSYAADGGAYGPEDTTHDLRAAAVALGNQLRELQREHPGREVDLIGHSQGGVVIALFLQNEYDPADPTLPPLGTVVTLASPLQGSAVATAVGHVRETRSGTAVLDALDQQLGGALPPTATVATAQLAEGSRLIRGLARNSFPEQIEVTSIAATDDVIAPADHAAPAGTHALTVNLPGPWDHRAIVTDPSALAATRLALEQRPGPCVGAVDGVRGAVEPVVISRAEHTAGEIGRAAGHLVDTQLKAGSP